MRRFANGAPSTASCIVSAAPFGARDVARSCPMSPVWWRARIRWPGKDLVERERTCSK
jgi:hypothetical protein